MTVNMDDVRRMVADPEFVARIRAEAVAQGLPEIIEDESFYRVLEAALTPTAPVAPPKAKRKPSAA